MKEEERLKRLEFYVTGYCHSAGCGYIFDTKAQAGEHVDECTCGLDALLKPVIRTETRMLPEEKELRDFCASKSSLGKMAYPLITALVLAVDKHARADERERCAKVADAQAKHFAEFAIRVKKTTHSVDDIVARRIASEDIAAAIREGGK